MSDINSSKSGTDKHFFNPNDSYGKGVMFAGVSLSPDRLHGRLLVFMPMQTLYDSDSYEMLESGKFKNTKKAVYFDTLESKELAGFIKNRAFNGLVQNGVEKRKSRRDLLFRRLFRPLSFGSVVNSHSVVVTGHAPWLCKWLSTPCSSHF